MNIEEISNQAYNIQAKYADIVQSPYNPGKISMFVSAVNRFGKLLFPDFFEKLPDGFYNQLESYGLYVHKLVPEILQIQMGKSLSVEELERGISPYADYQDGSNGITPGYRVNIIALNPDREGLSLWGNSTGVVRKLEENREVALPYYSLRVHLGEGFDIFPAELIEQQAVFKGGLVVLKYTPLPAE